MMIDFERLDDLVTGEGLLAEFGGLSLVEPIDECFSSKRHAVEWLGGGSGSHDLIVSHYINKVVTGQCLSRDFER